MKKYFLPGVFVLWACCAHAAPVTVAWAPNPPAEGVTGYTVHWGPQSRSVVGWTAYPNRQDTAATSLAVDIQAFPAYLAVTAFNQYGLRSDYSVELHVTSGTVLLLSPPQSTAKGLCARLAATRPDGSAAQVEACTDSAGNTTWAVLP